MNQANRLLCLLLAMTIVILTAGCSKAPSDIMDSGADRFAAGKVEDSYYLKNSGPLLEELIDKYSGSYALPGSSRMDDDEYDKAKQPDPTTPADSTDPADATSPTAPAEETVYVANWDDFLDAFHDAYLETSEYLEFELISGYTLDLNQDLQECFTQLQREDPIYVSCVKSWRWGSRGSNYVIEIEYTMDVDRLVKIKEATEDLVDDAAAAIDTAGKSDYEIVCAVNEYLCDAAYYPPTEPYAPVTHTAYGALYDGVAVCEGYACAAKLMLNKLGILCDIQVGTCTDGGGHAWNLVQLEGQWYQMDVTWNDGGGSRTDYLLVTDDYMRKSRTWDFGNYPACAPNPYRP